MANVVVVGGIIKCFHGGQVELTSGDSRLNVNGKTVLVKGQEVGLSFVMGSPGVIVGCPFMVGNTKSPCKATKPATTGISLKLTVGGLGVLLNTAGGATTNTPPATWSIMNAGQNKLESSE